MADSHVIVEGPRAVGRDEREALRRLVNGVFRSGGRGDMFEQSPVLYADENLDNCRIILVDGQPVSHVGCVVRDAALGGPVASVACLGSICTRTDCRGRGFSTALLDDCEQALRGRGIDLVLISGDRGLYIRRGARTVGRELRYEVTRQAAVRLPTTIEETLQGGIAEASTLSQLYASKSVRFVRTDDDWRRWLRAGRCENGTLAPLVGLSGGQPVAYVVHNWTSPRQEKVHTAEWAGAPAAVAGLIGTLAGKLDAGHVEVIADSIADAELVGLLDDAGLTGAATAGVRTAKVLRPSALFEKCRPHLVADACDIRATDLGEGVRLSLGRDAIELPVEEVATMFFGGPDDALPAKIRSAGGLGKILSRCLPFPLPRYGYNFV